MDQTMSFLRRSERKENEGEYDEEGEYEEEEEGEDAEDGARL